MDQYICKDCNLVFKVKKCLTAHLKTQKHLNRIMNKEIEENKYKCVCGKAYKYKQGLYTHRKTCKGSSTKTETEDEDVETLKTLIEEERQLHEEERQVHEEELKDCEEKIEELQEEIQRLKAEKSVINNNQNIETQNNINIHINAYGNENLDYITDDAMLRCINHITRSIPMLVSKIHFDPKHPENHNIKITNHRLPYVKVLDKKKEWKYANKEHTVANVIDKSYSMLETTYEGYKDEIPKSTQRNFERFQNKYMENDNKTMKNLNQDVEMIMMNGN